MNGCHCVGEDFLATLETIMTMDVDLIISSGAVSVGEYDFVKEGLLQWGADIIFHKIKLKPGKPNLFATLPSGPLYFGLPGNPVATAVGLRFLVGSALKAMNQQPPETPIY